MAEKENKTEKMSVTVLNDYVTQYWSPCCIILVDFLLFMQVS